MINRRHKTGGELVVVLLFVGLGAPLYYGMRPAPGGTGSREELTEFPTATPSDGGSDDGGSATETSPFPFTVNDMEECGQTCRDVIATLQNDQDETAIDVTVFTRIFGGENNTDTADIVWEGTGDVGTLEAGATHTTTERIELSRQDARRIDQHDGWITILTTEQAEGTAVTFQDSEQVA